MPILGNSRASKSTLSKVVIQISSGRHLLSFDLFEKLKHPTADIYSPHKN